MSLSIWYISKYAVLPISKAAGTRGFMIMRELARMGHRCLILLPNSNHLAQSPDFEGAYNTVDLHGVEICWIRTLHYNETKSIRRILSWIDFEWRLWRLPKEKFQRPDAIVVSSLSLLTIFNGLILRRRYGCRLIFEVRDIWPLTIIETGGYSQYNPFVLVLAMIERMAYRRADAIVGTMPNLKQHVAEVLGHASDVHCIPMGVDDDLIGEGEPLEPEYESAHIPKDKFIVCHAGAIGIDNALDTLFACARELRDRADIHFLIVGEGGLKEYYRSISADLSNVSFAPAVPRNMVQSILTRCDLLYFAAHASKVWKYGQSLNKVVDYMLSGKPIVASYTGYPSMLNESGCGVFVPAENVGALKREILRHVSMPVEERAKIGASGREWLLRNRRYKTLAEEYLKVVVPKVDG